LTQVGKKRHDGSILQILLSVVSMEGPNLLETDAQAPVGHFVQFYESPAFLCEAIAEYLAPALRSQQKLIVFTTPEHRKKIISILAASGLDVDQALRTHQFTILDARDTLSSIMHDGSPDAERFQSVMNKVLGDNHTGREPAPVRISGEMVDILCREGNPAAAIRLEELWNDFASVHQVSLMCAYQMANFYGEAHCDEFLRVCDQHEQVVPTERYTQTDESVRLREISFLQQRARALETEIERRKELEASLRKALDDQERVRAERERLLAREQEARAHAETASRLKDQFLAVVSHELRTPLTAILGWSQIVELRRDEQTQHRALEVIHRNAKLQLSLIDDLLDVSRVLTGKMLLNTGYLDLRALSNAAIESVRPAALAKGIDLQLKIDGLARPIVGDSTRLQQVLWNLLSNAIKFTPRLGRVQLRIEFSASYAHIIVEDTGQGIRRDFLPHVFDRFRQADAGTTRKYGGLGLGLALVRHLVEAHGGTVAADSRGEGKGAKFTVALPMRPASSRDLRSVREARSVTLDGVRLLVVDDELDVRELFKCVLEQTGAIVETAGSVDEAVGGLPSDGYDLLIADIGMPEKDGYALIRTVRSHQNRRVREMPAIAVTSYSGDEHRHRALEAGYNNYFVKPLPPEELAAIVSEMVHPRRQSA
jgi:signal transduction histidine kinase/ActR/RegA family two-component response regulator